MNTRLNQAYSADKENQLTLELLTAIDQNDDISQRHLAQEMGVALGLANSYLKRCVKKGWIKITTAPANRYLYYLTPNGFAEKARLTAEFLNTSLALFRQSGEEYSSIFRQCIKDGRLRVVLVGLSDLTEIALMRAMREEIEIIGVLQPGVRRDEFFNVSVFEKLPPKANFDCLVLTSLEQTNAFIEQLETQIQGDNIIAPSILLNMNYRNAGVQAADAS